MKSKLLFLLTFLSSFLLNAQNLSPTNRILYVTNNGSGNGASWESSTNLAEALKWANQNQNIVNQSWSWNSNNPLKIFIKEGEHRPIYNSNLNIDSNTSNRTFILTKNVHLYGGFLGNEIDETLRKGVAYNTMLTGHVLGSLAPNYNFNLDDIPVITNNNNFSNHVLVAAGTSTINVVLDGFRIENSYASTNGTTTVNGEGINNKYGGGIYVDNAKVIIKNCTFLGNNAVERGGAIYCEGSNGKIDIINTSIYRNGCSGDGSAAYANSNAKINFYNCTILNNYSNTNNGGALHVKDGGNFSVFNSIIYYNYAKKKKIKIYSGGSNTNYNFNTCILQENIGTGTAINTNDPLFYNIHYNNEDLRLYNYSPAIDAGNITNYPINLRPDQFSKSQRFKYVFDNRVVNCKIDIGAFEYLGNAIQIPNAQNQTLCFNSLVSNLVPSGNQYKWYLEETSEVPLLNNTILTSRYYYLSQIVNGCESNRKKISVTITGEIPPVINDKVFCYGATAAMLSGNQSNLRWFYSETGGTQIPASDLLQSGYYYAEQINNSCVTTNRARVLVTIHYNIFALLNEPVNITGYNKDLVSQTVIPRNSASSFNAFNEYLMSDSVPGATSYLPKNNQITSQYTGITYKLQSYTGNNAIQLTDSTPKNIEFINRPANNKIIYLLAGSSQESTKFSMLDVVIKFSDGTSQQFNNRIVYDWFYPLNNYAIKGIGRQNGNGNVQNSPENPKLFDIVLPIESENIYKNISSIEFKNTSSNREYINIFAISRAYNPEQLSASVCEGAKINDLTQFSSKFLWYTNLDSTSPLPKSSVLHSGTYYVSLKIDTCETDRFPLDITVKHTPAPQIENRFVCPGSIIGDLTNSGLYQWYANESGGQPLLNSERFVSKMYYVSQVIDGCESINRTPVKISVYEASQQPSITYNVCAGATLYSILLTEPDTVWYFNQTSTTSLPESHILNNGIYYVENINNQCNISIRIPVNVVLHNSLQITQFKYEFCYGAKISDLKDLIPNTDWYYGLTTTDSLNANELLQTGYYYVTNNFIGCSNRIRTKIYVLVHYNIFSLYNEPVNVANYNSDIVASNLSSRLASEISFDAFGNYLIAPGLNTTTSMPASNEIISAYTGVKYKLKNHDENNSFRLQNGSSILVNFEPAIANSNAIYLLAASSQSTTDFSLLDIEVKFTNGQTQIFENNLVYDWFYDGIPFAINNLGRILQNNGIHIDNKNPKLFDIILPLNSNNISLPIESIKLTSKSKPDEIINVLAVSRAYNSDLTVTTCIGNTISQVTDVPSNLVWYDSENSTTPLDKNITVLENRDYYLTMNVGNCESEKFKIEVKVSELEISEIDKTNASCFDGNDGAITVNVTKGVEPYNYIWDDPLQQNSATATNLSAGTYNVTITDAYGCSVTEKVIIEEPSKIKINAEVTPATCSDSNNGLVRLYVSGGKLPYTYQWDDGQNQTTAFAENLSAGHYNVIVTDANGCSLTQNFEIEAPVALSSIPTHSDVSCFDGSDGTASVEVSGGVLPYSYLWSDENAQTTVTATNLSEGNYFVTITDANGCSIIQYFEIKSPLVLSSISTHSNVSCFGGNNGIATVQVSGGTLPYTYLWNDVNAQTTASATNLSVGNYVVTITDAKGCSIKETFVIEAPIALSSITTQTNVSCFGGNDGTATIEVSGGTYPYTYLWDDVNTQNTAHAINLSSGFHTVTVTDANNCKLIKTIEIKAPAVLSSISSHVNVSCFGGNDGSAAVNVSGGTLPYTYLWNDSQNQTRARATNLSVGNYTVIITDAKGCSIVQNVVIEAPNALSSTLTQNNVSCFGVNDGIASVNVLGGTLPYTYLWNDDNAQTTASAINLSAGNYTVIIKDANGCSLTQTVEILTPAALSLISNQTNVSCFGGNDGIATVQVFGGTLPYTYLWNDANAQTTATASQLSAGNYSVQITDKNGCSITKTIVITEPVKPSGNAIVDYYEICSGTTTNINLIADQADTYFIWSVLTNGVTGATSGTGLVINQNLQATGNSSGTVLYTITPVNNSCYGDSFTLEIKVNPIPTVNVSLISNSICSNSDVNIQLSSSTIGTSYKWSVVQNGVFGASDGSGDFIQQNLQISSNDVGTVTYIITPFFKDCQGESTTVVVSVKPNITPIFEQINPICAGGDLAVLPLVSKNGIEGSWYPSLNNNETTTYTFTPNILSTDLLCNEVVNMTIVVNPIPVVNIENGTDQICSGETINFNLQSTVPNTTFIYNVVSTNVTGAQGGQGNLISQTLINENLLPGNIVYAITPFANNCQGETIYKEVIVNPIPVISYTVSDSQICTGENLLVSFNSTVPGTTFSWQVIATNVTGAIQGIGDSFSQTLYSNNPNGGSVKYIVTPIFNGCKGDFVEFEIQVKPRPEVFGPSELTICSGQNAFIELSASHPEVTYKYTFESNNVSGAYIGEGNIINQMLETLQEYVGKVTYTITPYLNGCSGNPIKIVVKVNPVEYIDLKDGYICYDLKTDSSISSYTIVSGLNTNCYNIAWLKDGLIIQGQTNGSLEVNEAGTYQIQAVNLSTGCEVLSDIAIVSEQFVADSITAHVDNNFNNGTITIDVVGNGNYIYQLNNQSFQESNVFSYVLPGNHTVTVKDKEGCTYEVINVNILSYPNFFTPNGDGINDTWNIWSLSDQQDAEILIFDRYGKLIKQITPAGEGWDGKQNGVEVPSTDYWFVLKYRDGINQNFREFKSHFSLKR